MGHRGADPVRVRGRRKFGCRVSYGSDPHENFTWVQTADCSCNHEPFWAHRNIWQDLHQERPCKSIKHSNSPNRWSYVPDRTGGAYSAPSDVGLVPLSWWEGEHPLPKNPTLSALRASFFSPSGLAISVDPPQLCRRIGAHTGDFTAYTFVYLVNEDVLYQIRSRNTTYLRWRIQRVPWVRTNLLARSITVWNRRIWC